MVIVGRGATGTTPTTEESKEERLDRLRRRLLAAQPSKKRVSSEEDSSADEDASSDEDSSEESSTENNNKSEEDSEDSSKTSEESTEDTSCTTVTSTSEEKSKVNTRTNKTIVKPFRRINVDKSRIGKLSIVHDTGNKTSARKDDKKKRRRRRPMTICLTHCRYELVRSLAHRYALVEVGEDTAWNIYWTDYSVSLERAVDMRRFQIVNHFPGMNEICRKDLLARNLNRMKRVFPEDYNIYPMTWCLPADNNELQAYSMSRRGKTYICKPEMGCQGRGIFLVKNIKDLNPFGRIICQIYIQKPFLIDHLKFDLRIYVLITSCDPLRVWVYKEGLARFATAKYRQPTQNNSENSYMHLTNYAVNKFSRDFVVDGDTGTKRKLTTVYSWLEMRGYDVETLEKEIDDVILKTILSAQPILKHHYRTCFPHHDICSACFEILGFDILIDHKLKPFVIEVNHSPSFHTDTPLDQEIKESLLNDTFAMLHFKQLDRVRIEREDRRRVQERLSSKLAEVKTLMEGKKGENNPTTNRRKAQAHAQAKKEVEKDTGENEKPQRPDSARKASYVEAQFKWEMEHKGSYRLIYPLDDSAKYDKFLAQNQVSLYQETAASQARANLTRVQMDEYNLKKQIEEQKRCGGASVTSVGKEGGKVRPESASSDGKKKRLLRKMYNSILPVNVSNAGKGFNLSHIVAEEDCERVRGLIQRGLLIRSLGIELQAYQLLCKVGSLKKPDHEEFRRKHGFVLNNYQVAAAHVLARKDSFAYPSNAASSNPSRQEFKSPAPELFDPTASTSASASGRSATNPSQVVTKESKSMRPLPPLHPSNSSQSQVESSKHTDRKALTAVTPRPSRLENPGHHEEYFQAKMAQMEPMKTQAPPSTTSNLFTMRWNAGARTREFAGPATANTPGDFMYGRHSSNTNWSGRDNQTLKNSKGELPTGAAQIKAIAKMGPNFGGIQLATNDGNPLGRNVLEMQQRYDLMNERKLNNVLENRKSQTKSWDYSGLKSTNQLTTNTKPPVIPRFQYSHSNADGMPMPQLGRLIPSTQSQSHMSRRRQVVTPSLESAAVIFPRRGSNKITFSPKTEYMVPYQGPSKSPPTKRESPVITFENAPHFLNNGVNNLPSGAHPQPPQPTFTL